MAKATEKLAYNTTEAGQAIGVSSRDIRRMAKSGEIPGAIRKGKLILIPAANFRQWLDNLPSASAKAGN